MEIARGGADGRRPPLNGRSRRTKWMDSRSRPPPPVCAKSRARERERPNWPKSLWPPRPPLPPEGESRNPVLLLLLLRSRSISQSADGRTEIRTAEKESGAVTRDCGPKKERRIERLTLPAAAAISFFMSIMREGMSSRHVYVRLLRCQNEVILITEKGVWNSPDVFLPSFCLGGKAIILCLTVPPIEMGESPRSNQLASFLFYRTSPREGRKGGRYVQTTKQ